eukprot:1158187-Pelagomonas_calceolata.AAC.10
MQHQWCHRCWSWHWERTQAGCWQNWWCGRWQGRACGGSDGRSWWAGQKPPQPARRTLQERVRACVCVSVCMCVRAQGVWGGAFHPPAGTSRRSSLHPAPTAPECRLPNSHPQPSTPLTS